MTLFVLFYSSANTLGKGNVLELEKHNGPPNSISISISIRKTQIKRFCCGILMSVDFPVICASIRFRPNEISIRVVIFEKFPRKCGIDSIYLMIYETWKCITFPIKVQFSSYGTFPLLLNFIRSSRSFLYQNVEKIRSFKHWYSKIVTVVNCLYSV